MELARSIFVLLLGWYGFGRFAWFYYRALKAQPANASQAKVPAR